MNRLGWLKDSSEIGFALNQALAFDWGRYQEKPEDKANLFRDKPAVRLQASRLLDRSTLLQNVWQEGSTIRALESITYFHWLLQFYGAAPTLFELLLALSKTDAHPIAWLDVGAKNWSYAAAIPAFLETIGVDAYQFDGMELDTGRRYLSGHTRGQVARAYAKNLPKTTYHSGNILSWTQPAQVISSFLPFVFEDPHRAWGLPKKYFQPKLMLEHLICLLMPETGILMIINQGEAEAEAQELLFQDIARDIPINWQSAGQLDAPFIEYQYPRFGWLCKRLG